MRNIPLSTNTFTSFGITFHLEKQVLLPFSPPKSSLIPSQPSPNLMEGLLAQKRSPDSRRCTKCMLVVAPGMERRMGPGRCTKGTPTVSFERKGKKSEGLTFASFGIHGCLLYCSLDFPVAFKIFKTKKTKQDKKVLFISTI